MARGISNLQQTILLSALAQGGFVSSRAIIERVWGPSLKPEEAGYILAHVSLSRSVRRLWSRCLIDIFKKVAAPGTSPATVIGLTPEGEKLARSIAEMSG